jgi:hypothetical protein
MLHCVKLFSLPLEHLLADNFMLLNTIWIEFSSASLTASDQFSIILCVLIDVKLVFFVDVGYASVLVLFVKLLQPLLFLLRNLFRGWTV